MPKPKFITAIFLAFSISSATAGVLDNAWLRGVTDKDPVSYHAGEEIVFTVTPMDLDGPIPPDTYQLEWRYSDEGGTSDKELRHSPKSRSFTGQASTSRDLSAWRFTSSVRTESASRRPLSATPPRPKAARR